MSLNSKNNPLFQAAGWVILAFFISALNDALAKTLGSTLHPFEVTFLRFALSATILLPLGLWKGWGLFKTERPVLHLARGLLLFVGIALWCHGLNHVPMALATTINFTIPIFTLVLARIFLKEHVGKNRWLATLGGFAGVLIIFHPGSQWGLDAWGLLLASMLFAGLDVLNKRFVVQESMVAMLFWGSVATAVLGAYSAFSVWQMPSTAELILLACLGVGANGILFFLLKGFRLADASSLAPFRYIELLFAAIIGWALFSEWPGLPTFIGAAIIIPSTLWLALMGKAKDPQVSV